jgi:glycosyltransferase involved in cell wall biosynthesis
LSVRIVSVHHRLGGMLGHRYTEALGLMRATAQRGWDYVLLIREDASTEVRAELPGARAVLQCPVFRKDLSFDERTADFVAMLHRHLDPIVRPDDRVLVTTGTQCELRAAVAWLTALPVGRRPWVVVVFHDDRWNRFGSQVRERQVSEFRVVAAELARLDPAATNRLLVGTVVDDVRAELGDLLGIEVAWIPQMLPSDGYIPPVAKPAGQPVQVGLLGGARPEKGSHLIPAIIAATHQLGRIEFAVQIANEDLSPAALAELCGIEGQPGVRVAHGPLDLATYRTLLAGCDLILLPYDTTAYRRRASGPFIEACVMGRPVVVPAGSWMGDQVTAGKAAGVVYERNHPEAIAAAIMGAAAALPQLADLAKTHASGWERTMTRDPFLDWIEREISDRERVGADAAPQVLDTPSRLRRAATDLLSRFARGAR